MNFDLFNYPCVRSFLRKLLIEDKFKGIKPQQHIYNKYFMENKYAFYLGMDAIIKYNQIINDESLIEEYINQLNRIFKRYGDYNHITNGINSLIAKTVAIKLSLSNTYTFSSREKILRYIYNKYIINGYFYFGFSSNYLNEIGCVGIRSNTFFIDDRLKHINNIFERASGKKLFLNVETTITDDIIVALYFSFLSPYYLADMVSNPLFKKEQIDRECFYEHNILKIRNSLIKVCDNEKIDTEIKKEVVNNFVDCYNLCCSRGIKPCIAKISRASIGKNKLIDIDTIVNDTDENLASAVGLILDSRYNSCKIKNSISPYDIEVIQIPTYLELLQGPIKKEENKIEIIVDNREILSEEYTSSKRMVKNSYGVISLAYVGLLFIVVGAILAVFISFMGG